MNDPISKASECLRVLPELDSLNRAAASEFLRCAEAALDEHGRFVVALSGGNTPRSVYSLIASDYKSSLRWEKVFVFFGDERPVAPDSSDSNYRMAYESLLARVPIPAQNIHRIYAELDAEIAAAQYEAELQRFFHLQKGQRPRFDLILLGMGDDGHTASLFPNSAALHETSRLVVANWVEKLQTKRITFTLPVLNHAAEVLVLVAGESKAGVLNHVFHSGGATTYPIQRVQPESGRLLWMADQEAARFVPQNGSTQSGHPASK